MICLRCNVECKKLDDYCYHCDLCIIQYSEYTKTYSIHLFDNVMGFNSITQYYKNINSKNRLVVHFNHKKYNFGFNNFFTIKELYDFYFKFIENLEFV